MRAIFAACAGLVAIGLFAATPALCDEGPVVETLLNQTTTNLGQALHYPSGGQAQVRAIIVTLKPGQATDRHRHEVPLFGYILEGELTVTYEDHGTKVFAQGEALLEAQNVWHIGHNSGAGDLKVLAVFLEQEQ